MEERVETLWNGTAMDVSKRRMVFACALVRTESEVWMTGLDKEGEQRGVKEVQRCLEEEGGWGVSEGGEGGDAHWVAIIPAWVPEPMTLPSPTPEEGKPCRN